MRNWREGLGRCIGVLFIGGALTALVALKSTFAQGPTPEPSVPDAWLPFAAGERLVYGVRVGNLGATGRGEMSVRSSAQVRGIDVFHLRSEIKAGVGPITGFGRSDSWLDAGRMAALRFAKEERQFLVRHRETVEIFPETKRWTAADGASGMSPTDAPLDELSFIYYLRTLPLTLDTAYALARHFDAERNPVALRVLEGEVLTTPAGQFRTVLVEMRVKDPRHYRGDGLIRIHFTDDPCHLPVRIESAVPGVGKTVLTLESFVHPDPGCAITVR
jgi:hypothetical protein